MKEAAAEAGRSIDEDHYGAAFAYRFGGANHLVTRVKCGKLTHLLSTVVVLA
ncbi:MAG TPA: hypothetical protein VKF40_04825 [Burkholderiales bacterium]|nr:hypothetical protein [Burkholderiales bacterium]